MGTGIPDAFRMMGGEWVDEGYAKPLCDICQYLSRFSDNSDNALLHAKTLPFIRVLLRYTQVN